MRQWPDSSTQSEVYGLSLKPLTFKLHTLVIDINSSSPWYDVVTPTLKDFHCLSVERTQLLGSASTYSTLRLMLNRTVSTFGKHLMSLCVDVAILSGQDIFQSSSPTSVHLSWSYVYFYHVGLLSWTPLSSFILSLLAHAVVIMKLSIGIPIHRSSTISILQPAEGISWERVGNLIRCFGFLGKVHIVLCPYIIGEESSRTLIEANDRQDTLIYVRRELSLPAKVDLHIEFAPWASVSWIR
ncbi:hypothetical protein C8Q75DRAFT_393499 [Abortiporus biennis]|nr:hypothetical protein C8Q75DRAFT_393499 [Abortiporus biennis]